MQKRKLIVGVVLLTGLMAQERFTLTAPNGIAFSEFRGYETWQYAKAVCHRCHTGVPQKDFVFTAFQKR
jgi:hypothetical protein